MAYKGFFVAIRFLLPFTALALWAQQPVVKSAGRIDFQREIRPILSDNCFSCHGPDKDTRMAGLRLDTRDGAFSERKSGRVIVPGNPQSSLLYQRITQENEAARMPPISTHKNLTAQQKDVFRRWIEQGAGWEEHWAFVPPARPALPQVSAKGWVRNPIDYFVLAKLEAAGLRPEPEADRHTLIRRVSLDLTGLPPSPADVEAFMKDTAPNAYESLVDRLLASKRYGEHRARYWLDAARYADTHGVHIDNYREMWPYRDWVIQAFNRNLPFDRFTVEQIAGDLLPDQTLEHQVASGFQRCNVTTNEGGSIPEEVEAMYAKDRVETVSTVWLGLTTGCASCHDHKFDPISQNEFYQLAAFFRNTTQKAMDGNVPDTPPIVVIPRDEDAARWNQSKSEVARLLDLKQKYREQAEPAFASWLGGAQRASISLPLAAGSAVMALAQDGGDIVMRTHGAAKPVSLPKGVTLGEGPSKVQRAVYFGEKASLDFPAMDYFDADKPFSIATWVYLPEGEDNFVVASQLEKNGESAEKDQTEEANSSRGWVIDITARIPSLTLYGGVQGPIIVRGNIIQRWKPGTWNHITFTYDGSRDQGGLVIFLNGKTAPSEGRGSSAVELKGNLHTAAPLRFGAEGKRYFNGGAVADFHTYQRAISEEEARILASWSTIQSALAVQPEKPEKDQREALLLYYLNRQDADYRKLGAQLASLEAERRAIRRRASVTLVMQENEGSMPTAQILYRASTISPAIP